MGGGGGVIFLLLLLMMMIGRGVRLETNHIAKVIACSE